MKRALRFADRNPTVMVAYSDWADLGVSEVLNLNGLDGVVRLKAEDLRVEVQFGFY